MVRDALVHLSLRSGNKECVDTIDPDIERPKDEANGFSATVRPQRTH
jgi:hypothetical protein